MPDELLSSRPRKTIRIDTIVHRHRLISSYKCRDIYKLLILVSFETSLSNIKDYAGVSIISRGILNIFFSNYNLYNKIFANTNIFTNFHIISISLLTTKQLKRVGGEKKKKSKNRERFRKSAMIVVH